MIVLILRVYLCGSAVMTAFFVLAYTSVLTLPADVADNEMRSNLSRMIARMAPAYIFKWPVLPRWIWLYYRHRSQAPDSSS